MKIIAKHLPQREGSCLEPGGDGFAQFDKGGKRNLKEAEMPGGKRSKSNQFREKEYYDASRGTREMNRRGLQTKSHERTLKGKGARQKAAQRGEMCEKEPAPTPGDRITKKKSMHIGNEP